MRAFLAILVAALCCSPLVASAKAKPGRYIVDATGETVFDTTTKRTWQRAVPTQAYNWQGAKDACKALTTAGGGWRLPSIRELASLVDRGHYGQTIDKAAFPNTPGADFWSATAYSPSPSPSHAWSVDFGYGYSKYGDIPNTYRVRCVR